MLLLMLLLCGCSKENAEKQPVVAVQAATVERAAIQRVIRSEAVLFPLQQAAVTPKVAAPVAKFYVNRGSRVHKGQLLAVLENRDLAAAAAENQGAYEQAQAAYETTTAASLPEEIQKAKLDVQAAKESLDAEQKLYNSRKNLYDQGALPRKDLDQAAVALTQARNQYQIAERHLAALQSVGEKQQIKAAQGQLTSAQGKYEGAKAQLAYSEIRSPISGVVTDRPVYPGETPPPGTPLLTIMNTSAVIARAHIPQQEAALLKAGDPATLNAPGVGDIPAKVTLVSPAVDPNSTTIEIWVEAPNPDGRLRPGTTVTVSMVAQTVPDAVVIPATSLLTAPDGSKSVMVIGSDGRAHQETVETGIREGNEVQIMKGLSPGQRVVTAGAYGLPDNTKVNVVSASESTQSESKTAASGEVQ
jgi:multidrug efflux pump subunit AcrA (membrane-fusion protein)